ncbi:hypothetical protein LUZ60_007399 [Juncus effusus]|nr:hypothetical protein LUZ60_007399 [Juncus effusus]
MKEIYWTEKYDNSSPVFLSSLFNPPRVEANFSDEMLLSHSHSHAVSPSPPLPRSASLRSTFTHAWSAPSSSFTLTKGRRIERGARVICMAKERRISQVSKQIMRELSDLLARDQVVKSAILPESALGADFYLSSVTTITDVEVSADLQSAKVYVSVFGDERGKEVAMAGLKARARYIRTQLGRRMRLRLTPHLRFIEDDSIERGSRVIEILDEIKEERERDEREAKREKEGKSAKSTEESEEENDDDDDDWIDDEFKEDGVFFIE